MAVCLESRAIAALLAKFILLAGLSFIRDQIELCGKLEVVNFDADNK